MKKTLRNGTRVPLLVVLCVCALNIGAARADDDDDGVHERKIQIDEAPAAARAAIRKAVGDGRIVDIGAISEDGAVVRYEVECIKDGREVDIVVSPDGALLESHVEQDGDDDDGEVVEGRLTAKAAQTVRTRWPDAAIVDIDVERAGGMKLHKVTLEDARTELEAEIAPDGTLVSTQRTVRADDVPSAARRALRDAAGRDELFAIEMEVVMATVESGRVHELPSPLTLYAAKFSRDGAMQEVVVDPNGSPARKPGPWRSTFDVDPSTLASVGRNPYFILEPGHRIQLAGEDETVTITVLDETRIVDGVEARVVEEREWSDGTLIEVSRNYFAIDPTTGDVYYFGEEVDVYGPDGRVTGHSGAWLSGEDGARFGLIMAGTQVVGDRYYQEYAPGAAMDRAMVVNAHAALDTPMKKFTDCLYIRESSDLERGFSHKWYAPGIGMIGDDDLRLVKVETAHGASEHP